MHAYLILAHKNWHQLRLLVKLLDDKRNDIYIHIDKKSEFNHFDQRSIEKEIEFSKVTFVDRVKVKWGDYSVVEAEMKLLKAAKDGNYKYLHLLSGMDLPLKTQSDLHDFFNNNNGRNYIYISDDEWKKKTIIRVKYYWPLQGLLGRSGSKGLLYKLQRIIVEIQRICAVNRCNEYTPKTGSQWFSITGEFARALCENEELIKKWFSQTFCADEWVIPSMAAELGFMNTCNYAKSGSVNLSIYRYIDWTRGEPYTFTKDDYKELMDSDCLFARKFDETIDTDIIEMIYSSLASQ